MAHPVAGMRAFEERRRLPDAVFGRVVFVKGFAAHDEDGEPWSASGMASPPRRPVPCQWVSPLGSALPSNKPALSSVQSTEALFVDPRLAGFVPPGPTHPSLRRKHEHRPLVGG